MKRPDPDWKDRPALTDDDIMPFGKHKGKKMINVPAEYLLYMWDLIDPMKNAPLFKYIEQNADALLKEEARQRELKSKR